MAPFIFGVNGKTEINIVTKTAEIFTETIKETGIIEVEDGTKILSSTVQLKAAFSKKFETVKNFITATKLPSFTININKISEKMPWAPELIPLMSKDKLEQISKDLNEIRDLERKPLLEMISKNEYYSHYIIMFVAAIVIIIAIIVCYRCGGCMGFCQCFCKCCWKGCWKLSKLILCGNKKPKETDKSLKSVTWEKSLDGDEENSVII